MRANWAAAGFKFRPNAWGVIRGPAGVASWAAFPGCVLFVGYMPPWVFQSRQSPCAHMPAPPPSEKHLGAYLGA